MELLVVQVAHTKTEVYPELGTLEVKSVSAGKKLLRNKIFQCRQGIFGKTG